MIKNIDYNNLIKELQNIMSQSNQNAYLCGSWGFEEAQEMESYTKNISTIEKTLDNFFAVEFEGHVIIDNVVRLDSEIKVNNNKSIEGVKK
tara:strand:- start:8 stop:280 length:273 start_codon:yes stop_codon:yes gene_type:complete